MTADKSWITNPPPEVLKRSRARRADRKLSDDDLRDIHEAMKHGWTLKALAKMKYKCGYKTITLWYGRYRKSLKPARKKAAA